jgi:uncharacterized membrane protein
MEQKFVMDNDGPSIPLAVAAYVARTLEVWLRAFGLGFGAHLMLYLYWYKRDATFDDVKAHVPTSVVAMACFVFGLSLFLPAQFRINWFDYTGELSK